MSGIELRHVSFAYENGYTANKDLDLRIAPGERVAIIGQNGAGKTTAAKLMNGLNKPTAGDVLIDGINTKDRTTAQIARHVGYVFQNPDEQIFNSTVVKEIQYMPRYYHMEEKEVEDRTEEALRLTELTERRDANPFDISYSIRKFVTIAAVLATKPKYTIWDEPTAGQDWRHIKILNHIMDDLREREVAVIVITHDMDFVAESFDRVVVMADRHIIADSMPAEVFRSEDIIQASSISRPQVGEISHGLGIPEAIIYREDLLRFLRERRNVYHGESDGDHRVS